VQREHYWPEGVPRDFWIKSVVLALAAKGFSVHQRSFFFRCREPAYDPNFETIALFQKGGKFKHVAMQIRTGWWKSKLGDYEDIEHPSSAMHKGNYGKLYAYLRRPITAGGASLPDEYRL
jgi:hypothetical protein